MIRTVRDRENPYPTDNFTLSDYVRIGRVIEVYDKAVLGTEPDKYGCVRVIWIDVADPNNTDSEEIIPCLTPGASWSWGSGIYRFPHINDKVAVLQLPNGRPIVIGYIPYSLKEAVAVTEDTINSEVGKLPPMASGDILLKSSGQNEVFISNEGVVRVITRDKRNKDTIYTDSIQTNTEPTIDRVNCGEQNITSIFTLGETNKKLGCGSVVAEIDVPSYTQEVITREITNDKALTLDLPFYSYKIPTSIIGLTHFRGNKSTYFSPDNCALTTTYSYTRANSNDKYDLNINPLTLDNPVITSSISLGKKITNILKPGDIIYITLVYKTSLSNLQFNNLGDCQLTGRNIVLKNNKNVSIGLFDDGSLRMSAGKTEIGDTTTGHIRLNQAGVSLSRGLNKTATVTSCNEDKELFRHLTLGGTDDVTGRHYFAVSDTLPLFCYDTTERIEANRIKVVSKEEYDKLGSDIRLSIPYKNLDAQGPLTLDVINNAISRGEQDFGVVYTYGELRR